MSWKENRKILLLKQKQVLTECGDMVAKNAHMVERSWSDNPRLDERKLRSVAVHMVESSGCSLTLKGTAH